MNNRPLVIAGSGRSGTTWILDVLAETNNLRPVFEPLNPLCVAEAHKFTNIFIKEDASDPELKEFMGRVFAGELNSLWTRYRLVGDYLKPYPSRMKSWQDFYGLMAEYKKLYIRYVKSKKNDSGNYITKFIRANLFLGWMKKKFDIRLVFIVRHPCAVILSKITASKSSRGNVWDFNDQYQQNIYFNYKKDKSLCEEYLSNYSNIFEKELSETEFHTVIWCIENLMPIYKFNQEEYPVFFYEDIVMQPEREFGRMNKILGFEKMPESALIDRPSQQSSQEFKNQGDKLKKVARWLDVLTSEELCEIDEILNFFNVTLYNAYEPLPISRIQETL